MDTNDPARDEERVELYLVLVVTFKLMTYNKKDNTFTIKKDNRVHLCRLRVDIARPHKPGVCVYQRKVYRWLQHRN